MDIESIIFSIVFILVVYYVIKFLPRLLGIALTGIILSFVIIFVLRDMWNLPVDQYVNVSKFDEVRLTGQLYIDDIRTGSDEDPLIVELEEGDEINTDTDNIIEEDYVEVIGGLDEKYYSYKYVNLSKDRREEIIEYLEGRIEDKRFKEKLLGMNLYVDIEYDLGNAEMYNLFESKELIIEFK